MRDRVEQIRIQEEGSPWASDVPAGLVVFLVAVPLCLGIALASGAPLMAGLVTGVIGGLVVSWLGGTHLLVSGPAAGLAAIVLAAITELGSFEVFLAAVVIAGLLQLGMGLLRAGRLAALVPSSVVSGMLFGIGVLLVLQQLPYALGATPLAGAHGFGLLASPIHAFQHLVLGPTLVAAVALAALVGWGAGPFSRIRRWVPAPLAAVVAGTVVAELLPWVAPALALGSSTLVDLPAFDSLASVWTAPSWDAFTSPVLWRVAVTLALVASLETLLSLEATDRMDPLRRTSDPDRELVAQGVGNTFAGLLGGLPMTGVIVRSAANVSAGGRTWRSAFVHGVLLVVAVVLLPGLLERVPLAALAAVLLHTGWSLAHPARIRRAFHVGRTYGAILVTTVLGIVLTDLLLGVALGLVASAISALVESGRHGVAVSRETGTDTPRFVVELSEAMSFVHKARLREALAGVPHGADVTVDGSRTRSFDHDVVELLHGFDRSARDRGIRVRLVGVPEPRKLSA